MTEMGTIFTTASQQSDACCGLHYLCITSHNLSGTHRPVEAVDRLLQSGQGPGRDLERGRCLMEVTGPALVSLRGRDSVKLRGHP